MAGLFSQSSHEFQTPSQCGFAIPSAAPEEVSSSRMAARAQIRWSGPSSFCNSPIASISASLAFARASASYWLEAVVRRATEDSDISPTQSTARSVRSVRVMISAKPPCREEAGVPCRLGFVIRKIWVFLAGYACHWHWKGGGMRTFPRPKLSAAHDGISTAQRRRRSRASMPSAPRRAADGSGIESKVTPPIVMALKPKFWVFTDLEPQI